jgi:undecaprenyl pyrophosphate phosphatase UppP
VAAATKRKMTQQQRRAAVLVAVERVARLTAAIPVEQAIHLVFLRLKEIAVALVITRLACILSLAAVAAHQQPEPMDRKTLRPVFREMAEPELRQPFLVHQ